MLLDEQDLRERLKATADRVQGPGFTAADVAGRIRRSRARIIALASGLLLAVAAVAVAVPATLINPTPGPESVPSVVKMRMSLTVTVNGQSRARPKNGPPPVFTLHPGEQLNIRVGVLVQEHAKVTNLWLGIARDRLGSPGPDGQRPAGLQPVLAHAPGQLTPGPHTFRLAWTMPAHLPRGGSVLLAAGWQQPNASIGSFIAEFVLPPGSVMSAAQACREVMRKVIPGVSFSGAERVRLVLTRYAHNPIESTREVGTSRQIPLRTLVWVIEVHAKAIHWQLAYRAPSHTAAHPDTDFSVVMNVRTAVMSDFGESSLWPLPLSKLGTVGQPATPLLTARSHKAMSGVGRARHVPDRRVNHQHLRSVTDKRHPRSSGLRQVIDHKDSAFQADHEASFPWLALGCHWYGDA